jgi:hypothetical protein
MNSYLTISKITHECLEVLRNNLVMARYVNREYNKEFAVKGAKIGQPVSVRKPPRYVVKNGATMLPQDYVDESVTVSLDRQKHVGLVFTSADRLLSLDDFSKRVIEPAIAPLANQIDYDLLQLYKQVPNFVGTPGVVPTAHLTYLNAGVDLTNEATPKTMRYCVVGAEMQATIVNAGLTFQNPTGNISKQFEDGIMGRALGFDWADDQNVGGHTVGAIGGTPAVDGAQIGASILTKNWSALATLKEGDKITIAGVYAVNPQSRQSTGKLRKFTVTADVAATGGGAATVTISPAIVISGSQQNCTAGAAANALISVWGNVAGEFDHIASAVGPVGLAFHRNAFALVTADLPLPEKKDASRVSDPDLGISLRLWNDSDIRTDEFITRVDVLYGVAALRPELACVIAS